MIYFGIIERMITIILVAHLLLAGLYTLCVISMTFAAALKKAVPIVKNLVVGSFTSTIASGVLLVVVSPKTMAHFCVSTLVASALGVVAWSVYKKRLAALQPQQSTIY
jgi:hypothetical protein